MSKIYDQHRANVGLTIMQFAILNRLRRHGRLTMQRLAAWMATDRTTVVRAINDDLAQIPLLQKQKRLLPAELTTGPKKNRFNST
ncbi:helix-turn-helix domain-containing protein [Trinickia mobilis]|uniref:helix-turn-helix domain-containing protein n=1 Tax=Trinickia mobilis TaxID=2816356 RepID=UPI001A8D8AEA